MRHRAHFLIYYDFFRLFDGKTIGLESSLSRQTNQPNFIVFQINAKVNFDDILNIGETGSSPSLREGGVIHYMNNYAY